MNLVRGSLALSAFLLAGNVLADTVIPIKPELSLGMDGKVAITNARPYCPDASSIYIDTATASGKAMYSFALAANMADKQIYVQTTCTCNLNCGGLAAPVYKICSVLNGPVCE